MNDLDDELLKELGLEPKSEVKPKPAPVQAPANTGPKPAASAPKPAPKAAAQQQAAPAPASASKPASPRAEPAAAAQAAEKPRSSEPKKVAPPAGIAQATQVQVVAVVGKKTATLKELLELNEGSLIELNKLPNEMIDLVANGKLVAKGQLVLIEGRVGVQIKQVYR